MGRLFGTDGVRGVANETLTPEIVYKLGKAGAHIIAKEKEGKFIIGTDTRISCDMLKGALNAGICARGFDVLDCGIIPTPAVAYLTRELGIGGVVISASHNPYQDNGIKFFSGDGYKLTDEEEDEIEYLVTHRFCSLPTSTGENIGRVIPFNKGIDTYIEFLTTTININLEGMNIALDCAHGATYKAAPMAFKKLGAKVKVINNKPNGININVDSGSTHTKSLQETVKKFRYDFGFAFDGDGDRVIASDHEGNQINGDKILAVLGKDFKVKGLLNNSQLISTVMSNIGLEIELKKAGIEMLRSPVGDRYVLEYMKRTGAVLGGEQSGHVICSLYNTTGDGLLTALLLTKAIVEQKSTLKDLASHVKDYPQILVNVSVKNKDKIMDSPIIKEGVLNAEKTMEGSGRILVRPSGTESLVRVMVEGIDNLSITELANKLAEQIRMVDGK